MVGTNFQGAALSPTVNSEWVGRRDSGQGEEEASAAGAEGEAEWDGRERQRKEEQKQEGKSARVSSPCKPAARIWLLMHRWEEGKGLVLL